MDWAELLKTTFGPLVGAAAAVAAIWAKESVDRRRATQEWYEKVYIEEGIDRLAAFIVRSEFALTDLQAFPEDPPFASQPIVDLPVEAILRLQILLQNDEFTNLFPGLYVAVISIARDQVRHDEEISKTIELAHALHVTLDLLRHNLLKLRIRRKGDVYSIAATPAISSMLAESTASVEEARARILDVQAKLLEAQTKRSSHRRKDKQDG